MALRTVGTGQTYASVTAALSGISAGDSIVVRSNLTENINISTNFTELYSDNGSSITSSGNSATFIINNGLTQTLTIRDIILSKTSGLDNMFTWNIPGAGSQIKFLRCDLRGERPSGNQRDIIKIDATLTTTDQLLIERCIFTANAQVGGCITIGTNTTTANAIRAQNCILVGNTTSGVTGIKMNLSSATNIGNFYNCTIYGFNVGVNYVGKTTTTNCMFVGNTTDKTISGSADKTDFNTCAFAQQTNDGGWNSGTIFGLTLANELINASGGDFNLKAYAQCIDSGTVISTLLDDYNGSERPRGNSQVYDIGATEYQKFILT